MSGIVWLASYPKSGNTWFRALLANYLSNRDKPVDINNLGGGPIASARTAFDDGVGVAASDLTEREVACLRPKIYRQIMEQCEELPLFLKVHDAYLTSPEGLPYFAPEVTRVALYLIRNPLDVAPSYANHSGISLEKSVRALGREEHGLVLNQTRLANQLPQQMGSWSEHVKSWVDAPGLSVHVVRYEDMHKDTELEFSKALTACGLEVKPDRVAKAVDFSRFDRMKEQEAKTGFGEKPQGAKSFFRKGQVGDGKKRLSEELQSKIRNDHEAVMKRFGYWD